MIVRHTGKATQNKTSVTKENKRKSNSSTDAVQGSSKKDDFSLTEKVQRLGIHDDHTKNMQDLNSRISSKPNTKKSLINDDDKVPLDNLAFGSFNMGKMSLTTKKKQNNA